MRPLSRRTAAVALAVIAAMSTSPAASQDEPPLDEPATALRVAVDRALGEHAFLVAEVVRSALGRDADFTAAAAALEANTADVVGMIRDVYGDEAAEAFADQWRDHIAYIVDYGRALADRDHDAAELASDQLDRYVTDFSEFLAGAAPALPPDAIEGLIGEHVQQLEHVASFHEADFDDAYAAMRETYAHMFEVGDGLADGIVSRFPDRFSGRRQAFSPATDLRVTLDRLLGEHTYLAAIAMRAVLRDAADVESAADALAANSDELSSTIGAVYGAEAREAFGTLWQSHVDAYLEYVSAIEDRDADAADDALQTLESYGGEFGEFVADVNPFLSSGALESLVGDHTEHLVELTEAYADRDYDASYEIGREAYAHAGELSSRLAAAIMAQFPQRFPDTAVDRTEPPIGVIAVVAAAVAIAAATAAVPRVVRRLSRRSAR